MRIGNNFSGGFTWWNDYSYSIVYSISFTVLVTKYYAHLCVELEVPTKIKIKGMEIYPNNSTYVTQDINDVMNKRKAAFKNKDWRLK